MIPAWHLLWIVPVSASFGVMIIALFAVAQRDDDFRDEWRDENDP